MGDSFGGYYLSVKHAGDGEETVEVPPSPLVVDSPFGKMIVYEGQLSGISIQAPADWIEEWPDEEVGLEVFLVRTPEEESVVIIELDLFASGEGGTSLEEFVDDFELSFALVLQSQMKQAAFVVALPGLGLVPPSPPRPGQDEIRPLLFRPYQAGEQSAYLRDRQGYQRFIRTVAAPFSPCSIA